MFSSRNKKICGYPLLSVAMNLHIHAVWSVFVVYEETLHPWLSKMFPGKGSNQTAQMHRLIWIFARLTSKGLFSDIVVRCYIFHLVSTIFAYYLSRVERKTIFLKPLFRGNLDPFVNNANLGAIAHTSNGI